MRDKNIDKWASYFAEDVSGLYPGARVVDGKAALKEAAAGRFSDPSFSMMMQSTRLVASKAGDMAFSQGTYILTMTIPKTRKPSTDTGKYMTIT